MTGRRELTGRRVLIIALAAFGTVIAANLVMLFSATGTFPGLVVKNSYTASQGWNDRDAAQAALGWLVTVDYAPGALNIRLEDPAGAPVTGAELMLVVGRPSTDAKDRRLRLIPAGDGYRADLTLAPGAWRYEITTVSGPAYQVSGNLLAPEPR